MVLMLLIVSYCILYDLFVCMFPSISIILQISDYELRLTHHKAGNEVTKPRGRNSIPRTQATVTKSFGCVEEGWSSFWNDREK